MRDSGNPGEVQLHLHRLHRGAGDPADRGADLAPRGSPVHIVFDPTSWAESYCQGLAPGSDLVSINRQEEETYIAETLLVDENEGIWIGCNKRGVDSWVWPDGTSCAKDTAAYHNWNENEPADDGDCVERAEGEHGWNDVPCDRIPRPFVCEIEAISSTPTASPTPCTDINADPTFVDELPAPICANVLAQNECEIPAIWARCNFTCTGCTTAPVTPPAEVPTASLRQLGTVPPTFETMVSAVQVYSNDVSRVTTVSDMIGV